jgi:hypothetical protein
LLQPHLDAVGQVMEVEGACQDTNDIRVRFQHRRHRLTEIARLRLDPEDAIRLVVDQRQPAIERNREDTIAHPRHEVPEEGVVDIACLSCTRDGHPRLSTAEPANASKTAVPTPALQGKRHARLGIANYSGK